MLNKLISVTFLVTMSIGCTDSKDEAGKINQAYETSSKAAAVSPAGTYCEIQAPTNRGRGNDNTETVYYPAFLRGDVDMDGIAFTRADAQLATKRIYVKQINNAECPATADIGTFPQGLGPDGFFTAEDIVLWGQIKQGKLNPGDMGLVCGYDCAIVNHMDPNFSI
jgi:hypothetical protein